MTTEREQQFTQYYGYRCSICNYTKGLTFFTDPDNLICATCPKPTVEEKPKKRRSRKPKKEVAPVVDTPEPVTPEVIETPEPSNEEVVIDETEPPPEDGKPITE